MMENGFPSNGDKPSQDEIANLFVLAVYAARAEREYRHVRQLLLDKYQKIDVTGPSFSMAVEPQHGGGQGFVLRMRKKVGEGWVSPAEYDGQVAYPPTTGRRIVRDGDAD